MIVVKQVYRSRREQGGKRISDWCSQVHLTLTSIGLGHIWDSEEVGSEKDWKSLLKASIQAREERLDCRDGSTFKTQDIPKSEICFGERGVFRDDHG